MDGVDLDLLPGEIHALVGENGAGKSTLANIAFGAVKPDGGTIETNGTVGLVHQHFELVGRLRVWQNIMLGREPRKGMLLDVDRARSRVAELAERNGLAIDPDALVEELPIGVQQRVELLRELEREPSVLLLDEPTAALAPAEIATLFATVVQLAKRGTAIMVVTHKLQEVIDYTTRVSVMRHGKIVARYLTTETSTDEIARAMVGGELPQVAQREATGTQPCLSVRELSAGSETTTVSDLSFEVSAGEIVGIAGVEGNGQTALADAIAGMIPYTGAIEIYDSGGPSGFADGGRGAEGAAPLEPRGPTFAPYRAKVGIVPQDRHHEGLVLNWSIVENAILGRQNLPGIRKGALTDWNAARADAEAIIERFDVRAASADVPVRTLSGGNQQKLLVGRALLGDPRFVLAYQPTRGIDVGAAALVQSRLIEARNRGCAILLISFELDEILALADRVLVMFRGKITGSFSGAEIDRGKIGRLMAGLT